MEQLKDDDAAGGRLTSPPRARGSGVHWRNPLNDGEREGVRGIDDLRLE